MKIREIAGLLNASVLNCSEKLDREIEFAFATDLMSDVLTVSNENLLLITGLVNVQTIRTAEMLDIECILYVRNKTVPAEMIELATEKEIVLLEHHRSMFNTCAALYNAGVKPVF